jgi:PIN domain nuclease of toxin-antitoxin system
MGAEGVDLYEDSVEAAPDVYLLDTSTLLWSIMCPGRLSEAALAIWQDPKKLIAVSVVSYWEVAIKANKRIFQIDDVVTWWARRVLPFSDLETLPIREEHVSELIRLPEIHKDPFDRMLIAQARVEDMWLVTCDALIRSYPAVRVVW